MRATIAQPIYQPATAELRAAWAAEVTIAGDFRTAYGETEAEAREEAEGLAARMEVAATAQRMTRGMRW